MIVFVSGPYRARTIFGRALNIYRAWKASKQFWCAGHVPIVPHCNSAFQDGTADDAVFLKGDLEILRRCDAIYLLPNWKKSQGAKEEYRVAKELGLVVMNEHEQNARELAQAIIAGRERQSGSPTPHHVGETAPSARSGGTGLDGEEGRYSDLSNSGMDGQHLKPNEPVGLYDHYWRDE